LNNDKPNLYKNYINLIKSIKKKNIKKKKNK
jgi:hypothetical protein